MGQTVSDDPVVDVTTLTLEQQVALLSGTDAWTVGSVPGAGVPPVRVTDGPAGARGTRFDGAESINVPCGTALAASFDADLVERVGALLGRETLAKGARMLLAPTVNLHRTPIGGRNFECMSEDAHHTAVMATAYVRGVQSQGVAACMKHFVGNDSEFERMSINSVIDEVTLHELYLRPFEDAVHGAGLMSVMTGYNRINGPFCADSTELVRDVLREDWGFDGIVVSDWFAEMDTVDSIVAGVDVEMPGPTRNRGEALVEAVRDGRVEAGTVAAAAQRVVDLWSRLGALADGGPGPETTRTDAADLALVREASAAGTVLLRNEDGVLPLDPSSLVRVAVIGPNARVGQPLGGGSAFVNPVEVHHPLASIEAALPGVRVDHAVGCTIHQKLPAIETALIDGLRFEFWRRAEDLDAGSPSQGGSTSNLPMLIWTEHPLGGEMTHTGSGVVATTTFTPDVSGTWRLGLTTVHAGRLLLDGELLLDNTDAPSGDAFFGLGRDEVVAELEAVAGEPHEVRIELRNPPVDLQLIGMRLGAERPATADPMAEAVEVAREADVAIVVVGTSDDWESEGYDRSSMALPGDQDQLVHEVAAVAGRTVVVVNAGSPVLMPWLDEVDAVVVPWFGGQAMGLALADVLTGASEPGGRLPVTFPQRIEDTPAHEHYPGVDGTMTYGERRLVGHHHYTTNHVEPLFPFGAGLGWGSTRVVDADVVDGSTVRVTVANDGDRDGTAVVQVYAHHDERTRDDDPAQRFVGSARVPVPAGGEASVDVALDRRTRQHWQPGQGWITRQGDLELRVGTSSADLPVRLRLPQA